MTEDVIVHVVEEDGTKETLVVQVETKPTDAERYFSDDPVMQQHYENALAKEKELEQAKEQVRDYYKPPEMSYEVNDGAAYYTDRANHLEAKKRLLELRRQVRRRP